MSTSNPPIGGQESIILEKLVKFGVRGSGVPIQQSAVQSYALLGESIEKELSK
jgi:hypothetical protein